VSGNFCIISGGDWWIIYDKPSCCWINNTGCASGVVETFTCVSERFGGVFGAVGDAGRGNIGEHRVFSWPDDENIRWRGGGAGGGYGDGGSVSSPGDA